jgi:ABC-type nitrate/sulfonate/bicarbonate transport system ATPase subunit
MTDTLLIDGLEKRFASHGCAAFRDISFSVGQGEFIALIGSSAGQRAAWREVPL